MAAAVRAIGLWWCAFDLALPMRILSKESQKGCPKTLAVADLGGDTFVSCAGVMGCYLLSLKRSMLKINAHRRLHEP